ncbi:MULTISPECIES: cytochrome P450 [Nocardia]|uniref:cytochrome P450 n=1 Tax=Nocardia TaxID=1817 RepID=UPI000D69E78A|nr:MULTISPECIES: cytochrome P450 [Nocardia]
MSEFESVDYFTDQSLIPDPYPYFDYLRDRCPVLPDGPAGVVAITGHQEALAVYRDPAMSSANAVVGPFAPLPFTPEGDDISDLLEEHRGSIPMAEHVVTMDADQHWRTRALLSSLLTPKRLRENEDFMLELADRQLDSFLAAGRVEFMSGYAKPFSTLVIADLLGVPTEDHEEFRRALSDQIAGRLDGELAFNPLEWLEQKFTDYITTRRETPRSDVLTQLALAQYPDGSTPEVDEVVKLATFLFAAGQETTTKLLSAGIRNLAEQSDLQTRIRGDRTLIPSFLEETLRLESPVKSHFRLARTTTSVGDCPISAGATVMLLPGASNRDPRKFPNPNDFQVDRRNVREHVAFGRGAHTCPGAPLARTEGRISMNRILDRMANIRIDETRHGIAENRTYQYEPTFVMRGLSELHIEFDSAS